METMRIFCKMDSSLSVAIRNGVVVLAPNDPKDPTQHWVKDCYPVRRLTDEQGQKAFVLMNKAKLQALAVKPSPTSQVSLVGYNGDGTVDLTMVWTEGADVDDGFREVKWIRDTSKTLNALNAVKDGTLVGFWPSSPHSANAIWKMSPHASSSSSSCGC
ncbi:hypothetical protein ACP4OV_029002 [Aristida adscensionis]